MTSPSSLRARCAAILSLACGALAIAVPRTAAACGGTFCDGSPGPLQMPVDQTGENILFVVDGPTVEAHIQIQYQGDAPHFAWLIPLEGPAQGDPLPTFAVGSQPLFAAMLSGTVPVYGYQPSTACTKNFPGNGTGAGGGFSGGGAAGGSGHDGGPTVVLKATVGAFDVTLLQGGTVDSVMQWLGDNGYQQPPEAMPILETYLSKNYLFAALKLTNGAGVDEIHPLVVRYRGTRPCVPLQLTAIAATENMSVRAFFLGNGRFTPTNYLNVELNDAQLDWLKEGTNYDAVVTAAVDSPVANGHAFVTEYAGTSQVINTAGVYSSQWDATPFPTIDPTTVISILSQQGLVACDGGGTCQFFHPLIQGILHEYLPPPAGIDDAAFYGCLACYKDQIDLTTWDGGKFGTAMIERIIQPGKRAQELVQNSPFVTRLFTTISPAEMTEDPDFIEVDSLPDVASRHLANVSSDCSGCQTATLPDGGVVGLSGRGGVWPASAEWPAMPFARTIRQVLDASNVVTLVDNGALIDQTLAGWNLSHTCAPDGSTGGAASTGAGGTTPWHVGSTGGSVPAGAGGSDSGAGATIGSTTSGASSRDAGSSSCSTSRSTSTTAACLAGLLTGIALLRRRR